MAVTRRCLRLSTDRGGENPAGSIMYVDGQYITSGQRLTLSEALNEYLAPAERIVSIVREDKSWFVFTESFGLGPPTRKGP